MGFPSWCFTRRFVGALPIPEQLAPQVERLVGRLHAQVFDHPLPEVLVGTGGGGAVTSTAQPACTSAPRTDRGPALDVRFSGANRPENGSFTAT